MKNGFFSKFNKEIKNRLPSIVIGIIVSIGSFFVGWVGQTAQSYITLTNRVDALEDKLIGYDIIEDNISDIKKDIEVIKTDNENSNQNIEDIKDKIDNLTLKLIK